MKKPYPVRCKDCAHVRAVVSCSGDPLLYCEHPRVNASDVSFLSGVNEHGRTECRHVRNDDRFFAVCGLTGKLWEAK